MIGRRSNDIWLDSTAVSIFVVVLVELRNTVFVNSTNITTNIETAVFVNSTNITTNIEAAALSMFG